MHFAGSLRHILVSGLFSFQWPILSSNPLKYWPFLLGHSRISLGLWKAQCTLEKRSIQPLSPLSFMARTGIVLLCLPPVSLHAFTRLFSYVSRASSRSISLFNFYDGELTLGERFARKVASFSSHNVSSLYATLGKIDLAPWHLTTRYNVCAIMEQERRDTSSEENSPAGNTTFHFRHIMPTTPSWLSLRLTLIKLSTFYF